jgi:hypothetical protein
LIVAGSDRALRDISDDAIIKTLLLSENSVVRKAAALKCIRALPRGRLRGILQKYIALDQRYYYNVIHWLDFGVSSPRNVAIAGARKAIAKEWEVTS